MQFCVYFLNLYILLLNYIFSLLEKGVRGRKGRLGQSERDKPLPPLLARVGGNIEVSIEIFLVLNK